MYHGADYSSHLLAKVGGFFILPMLGGLGTRVAATAGETVAPNANPGFIASAAGTAVYGALAYAFYKASESDGLSDGMQALFRGGMWGAGISAAFCAALPAVSPPGPMISGPRPEMDKLFNLLTAQAAGAVASKRSKARALNPAR
jgi:hypothetical protein